MEQNQIKQKMTQGAWEHTKSYVHQGEKYIASSMEGDGYNTTEIDEANAAAICYAVNNTYGNGVNPEAVSEMVKELKRLAKWFKIQGIYDRAHRITDILNAAKL